MTINEIDPKIVIEEDYQVKTTKYNGKYTKSTLFLLPMIDLNSRNRLLSKYLKNTFIDDKGLEHDFDDALFVLFKVPNLRERDWQDLCKAMTLKEPIKSHYLISYVVGSENGNHLIMFVFQIPKKHLLDFEMFKAGRYSLISDEYKKKFPRKIENASGEEVESLVWGALHKSDNLKNIITKEFNVDKTEATKFRKYVDTWDEIWDSPKENEEIYRYDKKETN